MKSPDRGSPSRMRDRGPIEEGLFVEINGMEQWITIRGKDRRNPALLMLSGPGFAYSPMTPFFAPWEESYMLVQWDQPGAGATYAKNGAEGTGALTLNRLTRDGLALAELLKERFDLGPISLFGVSAGTIIGLKLIRERPDLFAGYAGNGQVVNWARQEALSYAMILDRARKAADTAAITEIEQLGPPPWSDVASVAVKAKYANVMTPAEQAAFAANSQAITGGYHSPPADASYFPKGLAAFDPMTRATKAFAELKHEIERFDARALGLTFDVPVILLQGEEDAHTVTAEVEAYAGEITSPHTVLELIPGAGHASSFLRGEMLALLDKHLRPLVVDPRA